MTSALSFHVIYDAIDNDANQLRVAIANLRPRVINIVGGARKTQAFTFAVEMLKTYPNMRVIFRNYPDDGNHVKDRYKLVWHRDTFGNLIVDNDDGCQRWVDDNYNYLLAGLTVLTDNESVNDNMDVYARWQARIMDLCGAKGFKVAVGRFAVGNPREADYARMAPMWKALAKWHPLHVWSPNEYIPQEMAHAAGMINRYQQGIDAAKAMNPPAWPFEVSIGEYGVVYRAPDGALDAHAGFHDNRIGWDGAKAFKYLYDQWVNWYKQNGVDACIYCWGGDGTPRWERFRVDYDNAFIKALTDANTRGELEPMPTKPLRPAYTIPAAVAGGRYVVSFLSDFINVRPAPIVTGTAPLTTLESSNVVTFLERMEQGAQFWDKVRTDSGIEGWISRQDGKILLTPTTSNTPPVTVPPVIITAPPPQPTPLLQVSSQMCQNMIDAYMGQANAKQRIATAYTLSAQDDLTMAQQWRNILDQNAVKAA